MSASLIGVTPAQPVITPKSCNGATEVSGSYTLPADTAEITYSLSGNIITATPLAGYVLVAGNGYTPDSDGVTASFYLPNLADPDCETT